MAQPDSESPVSDESILKAAGVAGDAPSLLTFPRYLPLTDTEYDKLAALIPRLGDDSFETREQASTDLRAAGPRAAPILRRAARSTDVEIARRACECLEVLSSKRDYRIEAAPVPRLGNPHPKETARLILGYAPFVPHDIGANEARRVIEALALCDGKLAPILIKALDDHFAERRALAADVLSHLPHFDRSAIRKLLDDREPAVRLQVARALVSAKEKDALPDLIE